MQTEQIHVLNHNERKDEDRARKEFLSPPVIYYLPFQVGTFVVALYCYEFVTFGVTISFFFYICVKFVIWFHRLPSRHLFGKELLTRFAMFRLVVGLFVLYVFP